MKVLHKRSVITVFVIYAFLLVLLDVFGCFAYEKRSRLYDLAEDNAIISVEGKIISAPESVKNRKRFILKTSTVNGNILNEKIIVNSPAGYSVSYGDIISIEGKLKKPFSSAFPLVFDYQKYLARNEIYTILDISSFEYIESNHNIIKNFAFKFQQDMINKIDAFFQRPCSDILKSLLIGDKSSLTHDTKNTFSDSGVMHILVVSGLHVGFIGAIALFVLKLTGLSLKKASLLSVPFVFFYVFATGTNPPALRSAVMFACIFFSLALDREPLIYNSLALSALSILIFQPQQLFTASFQMSYGATIGIICFYNNIFNLFKEVKNKILRFFCGVLSVTISAQILLIPMCMYYFGKVSIISFVTNIIVVPLVGTILYMGVFFYFLTFLFQYTAILCSDVLSIILNFVLLVTTTLGGLKYVTVIIQKPTILQLILFFIFLSSMLMFRDKKRFIISAIILLLNFLYVICPVMYNQNKIFFNVYQKNNIITLHIKDNNKNIFLLSNTGKYYDKYYIESFKQFISFSGIKNADIFGVGFDKEKLFSDLANFSIHAVEISNKTDLKLDFNDKIILVDIPVKKLYIDNIEFEFENVTSFYYDTKNKIFYDAM
ncbi:MAG: ComEC family competence protein [Endomicrobium sp.]|nr:ComEC family competence protein [Endomicrobium sp.]